MQIIKEKLNKALKFIKNNLPEILVLLGLFFFIFAMFVYINNLVGFVSLGTILVISGFMLSFIKYKSQLK